MLTVKELREAIKDAPDHMPVIVKLRAFFCEHCGVDDDHDCDADTATNEFNRIVIDA